MSILILYAMKAIIVAWKHSHYFYREVICMNYISTRDRMIRVSSMEAIKYGISQDGGLFVPVNIPLLSDDLLHSMATSDYALRAATLLAEYMPDYSQEDLIECVNGAYNEKTFDNDSIAPVVKISEDLFSLELWHGPTCAFKDIALQILPRLMTKALKKTGENAEIAILVATSGDTGKAALEGFKDVPQTSIIVFYPENGVSDMQRLQMVSQEGTNVHVAAIEGNFDDAQTAVKAIFTDAELKTRMLNAGIRFSSANSINWGRLVPQIVYYISAYIDMVKNKWLEEGESFNVAVPTGNFGNILAAYYAKASGLPIHKLICASNSNNVLSDFINTGTYDAGRKFFNTISPSMDILISSNLERLLFELADRDDAKVRSWMANLKENQKFDIGNCALHSLKSTFWGGWADETQTMRAINATHKTMNYTLDPHTAVAKWVLDNYRNQTGDYRKCLLVSTASPFKFAKDVLKALDIKSAIGESDEFEQLDLLSKVSGMTVPQALSSLKGKKIIHTTRCTKSDMKDTVRRMLGINSL
jgi:threonine synthase